MMRFRAVKKTVFVLLFSLGIVLGGFAQQNSPIDLILLLDTSSSMSASYREVNNYITGPFLREFLRLGDTFHLISFSDKPRIEISRRVEGQGEVETIIGRMFLMYPLDPWSDIPGALAYTEKYIGGLPPSRPKKIVLISDGNVSIAPGSGSPALDPAALQTLITDAKTRLSRQNSTLDYVTIPLGSLPVSGRNPAGPPQGPPSPAAGSQSASAQPARTAPSSTPSAGAQAPAASAAQPPAATSSAGAASGAQSQSAGTAPASSPAQNARPGAAPSQNATAQPSSPVAQTPGQSTQPPAQGNQPAGPGSQTAAQGNQSAGTGLQTAQGQANQAAGTSSQTTPAPGNQPTGTGSQTAQAPGNQATGTGSQTPAQGNQSAGAGSQTAQGQANQAAGMAQTPSGASSSGQTAQPPAGAQTTPSGASPSGNSAKADKAAADKAAKADKAAADKAAKADKAAADKAAKADKVAADKAAKADKAAADKAAKMPKPDKPRANILEKLPLPIIGLTILALGLIALVIFFITRHLQNSPNRVMARAAGQGAITKGAAKGSPPPASSPAPQQQAQVAPAPPSSSPVPQQQAQAAQQQAAPARRSTPYEDSKPQTISTDGSPLMLKLFVEDQNTFIGKRNVHLVKQGYKFTIGGGKSDFLIFLVPIPPRIAELRYDGGHCSLIPRKAQYFPDIGAQPVHDCIGKTIRIFSDRSYELRMRIEQYEDPLIKLNAMLHSISVPG